MVFALLIAAILWNLGTWYLGLPASSSHTLIGSIVGVGLPNAVMRAGSASARRQLGARWTNVGKALLLSPLFGFALAAVLLFALKTYCSCNSGSVRRARGRSAAAGVDPRYPDPHLHPG